MAGYKDTNEDIASKRAIAIMRRKNIRDFFLYFAGKCHLPWLKKLCEQYKDEGIFPLTAISLLPSYYTDKKDKEIAAFAALILKDNYKLLEQVNEIRGTITDCPWEWFQNRSFVNLEFGKMRKKRIAGVIQCDYLKLANLMSILYDRIKNGQYRESLERNVPVDCSIFREMLKRNGLSVSEYRLRLLSLILRTHDGLGLGLWNNSSFSVLPPVDESVCLFLSTWMPDYKLYGSPEDAIRLFGFERDYDFFYAYLGYKELQKRNPSVCGKYATTYQRWYMSGTESKKHKWMKIMPEICFN